MEEMWGVEAMAMLSFVFMFWETSSWFLLEGGRKKLKWYISWSCPWIEIWGAQKSFRLVRYAPRVDSGAAFFSGFFGEKIKEESLFWDDSWGVGQFPCILIDPYIGLGFYPQITDANVCQKMSELGLGNIFNGWRALPLRKTHWNQPHTCYR
jgi:hypothetical protein